MSTQYDLHYWSLPDNLRQGLDALVLKASRETWIELEIPYDVDDERSTDDCEKWKQTEHYAVHYHNPARLIFTQAAKLRIEDFEDFEDAIMSVAEAVDEWSNECLFPVFPAKTE